MANIIYNSFKRDILKALINCETDTIKVMLVGASYTFNVDTHEKRSDVVAHEVSGAGYPAGGVPLVSKTVTLDLPNNEAVFDADNPVISTATISNAVGAVVYKSRGGAASADELICYNEFAAPASSTSGDFTININANGVCRVA
jgi:hypothetical protein